MNIGNAFQNVITFLSGYLGLNNFWDVLRTVLDVGIVAFLFYELMKILRDSRAWQIVKGIIIVLIIYLIADFAGFSTISYVLGLVVQALPVLLVVVFQSEIKRGLEGMGKGKITFGNIFRHTAKQAETNVVVDAVVDATVNMSKSRTGALIVFEQNTSLGELIKSGTIVDAEVSSQLLQLIFVPNTPLHDGAVIIRENKIYAASCFLPLSSERSISKELGTRHRAGIGVTETTDSVSIIVSEETGQISVAMRGKITRDFTGESLREFLVENVVFKDEQKKKVVAK